MVYNSIPLHFEARKTPVFTRLIGGRYRLRHFIKQFFLCFQVRSLYEDFGVSSILVIGGSGDYFQVGQDSKSLFVHEPNY